MLTFLVRWMWAFCATLYCAAPPYTAPGINAARSYTVYCAIRYVVRPFAALPPYTASRVNAARFCAVDIDVAFPFPAASAGVARIPCCWVFGGCCPSYCCSCGLSLCPEFSVGAILFLLRALTLPSVHAASWRGCCHHPY